MSTGRTTKAPGAAGPGNGAGGAGRAPGKLTRTQALPASVGPGVDRLVAKPAIGRFKPTEIGKSRVDDVTLTNVSDEPVSFWDFLQTVLDGDARPRPEGDFAVVGGETTGEPLLPGESMSVTVQFAPQATEPEDLKPRRQTQRAAQFAVIDPDGAAAGTFRVEGKARPPSAETVDEDVVDELVSTTRRVGQKPAPPRSYDEMRRHVMAARELVETGERDEAAELLDDVLTLMNADAHYQIVFQAARQHGLGSTTATTVVGEARSDLELAYLRLRDGRRPPVRMDDVLTSFLVAREPLQLALGEIDAAPSLQALNDATPAVLAGKAMEELGETAKQIVTDATFAAGFGTGVLEGCVGAVVDLASGAAEVIELAFEIAKAMIGGGIVGATILAADKLAAAFEEAPEMLRALSDAFQQGWNQSGSYARGNFRGEVLGYIAAQIAIIIVTGGSAAEGVAFASLSRWGKVAAVLRATNAAGDILSWAAGAGRGLGLSRRMLDRLRDARKGQETRLDAPDEPDAPDVPDAAHAQAPTRGGGVRRSDGDRADADAEVDQVADRSRPPYEDPRSDPNVPRRPLDRRELLPHRKLDIKRSWKELEKAQKAGDHSFALGRKLKDPEEGHALLSRLARGDASALEGVGISDYPKGLDTTGREWALIETRDGYALYSGGYNKVTLPSDVRIIGHTHPGPNAAVGHTAPDVDRSLRAGPDGVGLTFDEILADITNARNSGIIPSSADINAISDGTEHVLHTRFVHAGDARITNPLPEDQRPRVQVHMSDAKVLRWHPRTRSYWYEVTAVVKDSTGQPVWSGKLYAQWSAPAKFGNVFAAKPPQFPSPSNPEWKTP